MKNYSCHGQGQTILIPKLYTDLLICCERYHHQDFLVFPVEAADASQPLISVLLYLCNVAVLFLHTTAWWPWVWLTLSEYKRIQSSHSIYRLLFSIIIAFIVLKHASAKLHFISVIVSSSPEAKNWDFLLSESHLGVIYIPVLAWLDVQLLTETEPGSVFLLIALLHSR